MTVRLLNRISIALLYIFICTACASLSDSFEKNEKKHYRHYVDAPQGSYIKPYLKHKDDQGQHYKIHLAKNIGDKRQDTEVAYLIIPINFNILSFSLFGNHQFEHLKTPVTLIDIIDYKTHTSYARLRFHNTIYWLEYGNDYKKIPLFLDYHPENITIKSNSDGIIIMINHQEYTIPHIPLDKNLMMYIGIQRSDLLRYVGRLVPEQYIMIDNLIIK